MDDSFRSAHRIAVFPFAVGASPLTAEQADICRGFGVFVERRLNRLPGIQAHLQNLFISPDGAPERRGWLLTNSLWTVEQAVSFPFMEEELPRFLFQGIAVWNDDGLKLTLEVIDLEEHEVRARAEVDATQETALKDFFSALGTVVANTLQSATPGRLMARIPTKDPAAFRSYLLGLAAQQATSQGMVAMERALAPLSDSVARDGQFLEACIALERSVDDVIRANDKQVMENHLFPTLEKLVEAKVDYPAFAARLGLLLANRTPNTRSLELFAHYLSAEPRGELASKVLTQMARSHAGNNRIMDACQMLQRAVRLEPEDHIAWDALAKLYMERRDFLAAEDCWHRSLQAEPDQPEALTALAKLLLARGKAPGQALSLLRRSEELAPNVRLLAPLIVKAALAIGDIDAADQAATAWAEEMPEEAEPWLRLGEIRVLKLDFQAVEFCIRQLTPFLGKLTPAEKALFEDFHFALDHPQKYEQVQRLHKLPRVPASTGLKLAARLQNEVLIARFIPNVAELCVRLLQAGGELPKAIHWQEKVLAWYGNDPDRTVVLAELLERSGRQSEARAQGDRALQLQPNNRRAKALIDRHEERLLAIRRQASAAALAATPRMQRVKPEAEIAEPEGIMNRIRRLCGRVFSGL